MLSNTIYRYIAVICISCFHLTAAQAANVVIGQVAELTGQSTTTESMLAANMWFAAASKKGPHTYEIKSLDDKRDPVLTVSLTKQLIEQGGVQALFGYRSTPSLEALSRELASLKVPLVAPFNGAASVRQSAGEWGFFLRASYRDEAEKLVRQVGTIGISNIAIVHQQDPFGMEGLAGFQAALAEQKLKPSTVLSYDRKNLDVKAVIEALNLAQPSAVFMAQLLYSAGIAYEFWINQESFYLPNKTASLAIETLAWDYAGGAQIPALAFWTCMAALPAYAAFVIWRSDRRV